MSQYRLTKKFATDCKIKNLASPQLVSSFFDDWIVDVFNVNRNKIAMATHVQTMSTLLIPYKLAGRAEKIISLLPGLLEQFLVLQGYSSIDASEARKQLLKEPSRFCKTDNPSVLGFMNDFKRCVKFHLEGARLEEVNWHTISMFLSEMPIKVKDIGYITSQELLAHFLKPVLIH